MTPENFCYWLQGLFEVKNPDTLNRAETAMIKEHLKLVFEKRTSDIHELAMTGGIKRDKKLEKAADKLKKILQEGARDLLEKENRKPRACSGGRDRVYCSSEPIC